MPKLLIHDFYRVTKALMRQYNERFLVAGVTAQQYIVLHSLTRSALGASALAYQCGLDRATITSLVTKLEKKRLVKRTLEIHDRRSVKIELTTSGRELAKKLSAIASDFHALLQIKLGQNASQDFERIIALLNQ